MMKVRINEKYRNDKKSPAIQIDGVILEKDNKWRFISENLRKVVENDDRLEIYIEEEQNEEVKENKQQDNDNQELNKQENNNSNENDDANDENKEPEKLVITDENKQESINKILEMHWATQKKEVGLIDDIEFLKELLPQLKYNAVSDATNARIEELTASKE